MVEAYLVNGFKYGNAIYSNLKSSFKRSNLTVVPESLDTTKLVQGEETLFLSRVGGCISLIKMGEYKNASEANDAYANSSQDYLDAYGKFTSIHKSESDWNMVLIIDHSITEPEIGHSYYICNKISDYNYMFFNFIDACTIYQSVYIIKNMLGDYKVKKRFSKFDNYKIEIYMETLNCFLKPESFYVSEKEIKLIHNFYDMWKITELCKTSIDSLKSITTLFDFAFKNEKEKRDYLVSRMFSLLTLLLGFTTLYKEFHEINEVRYTLFSVFGLAMLVLIFDIVRHAVLIRKEKNEYKNNVHFGSIDKIE